MVQAAPRGRLAFARKGIGMKRILIAGMFLAACQGDAPGISAETIGRDWALVRMNGADAPANVTMDLSEAGRAAGQVPGSTIRNESSKLSNTASPSSSPASCSSYQAEL